MVDSLLSTGDRLDAIAAALGTALADVGATVVVDEPPAHGPTPFVVITGRLTPSRVALDGSWSMATHTLIAHTVHDSDRQARAVADLVRTWVLTQMTVPGMLDVDTLDDAFGDDPGGVHQVREAWTLTLQRV